VELWREIGAHARVGALTIQLGRLSYEEGRLADARAQLAEGSTQLKRIAGPSGVVAEATAFLGAVALEEGALEGALEKTAEAAASLSGAGDPLEAFVLAQRGVALCATGDMAGAEQVFDEVEAVLARGARESVARAVQVLRASMLHAQGDEDAAASVLRAAEDPRLGSRVRSARRLASQAIARLAQGAGESAAVRVADDGSWLDTPGNERVDLSRRRVLRRLLLALAEKRVQAPGELLASADLVASGWPGERMLEKSAQDRLWVAIRSLRRLGLDGVLITGREGYLLDPDVALELCPSG
jgi:ATP/maltotriose-dependent transcriptional regulator MalT